MPSPSTTSAKKTVEKLPAPRVPASSREKAKQPAKPDFAAKPRKRAAANAGSAASISPAERHHLIEVAAYYVAAGHGFTAGASDADWLAAERQIDDMIAAGRFTT